jgi:hypothetical protein
VGDELHRLRGRGIVEAAHDGVCRLVDRFARPNLLRQFTFLFDNRNAFGNVADHRTRMFMPARFLPRLENNFADLNARHLPIAEFSAQERTTDNFQVHGGFDATTETTDSRDG